MVIVKMGIQRNIIATLRHAIKLPNSIEDNIPKLTEMAKFAVKTPRIRGSL